MRRRFLLLLLLLAGPAAAVETWRLPRGVFPHEIAVSGEVIYVASTAGLWRLEGKGKVKRIGGRQRAAWPVAADAGRLWWLQDSRVAELDAASGAISPVRSLEAKRVGVLSRRHGLVLVDDEAGLSWSSDGKTWHGPVAAAQHGFALDRLDGEWWAITNPDPGDTSKFVLSRSRDLRSWTKAVEFTGRQPGSLAAGAGRVVVSEIGGVRVFDPRDLPQSAFVTVGPADERPAVYFEHGCFWLQGERDGLWRSADGRTWQSLANALTPLAAPLVQVGFAPDALILAGYTGKVIRVPLAALPSLSPSSP
jgi:hypothetical protein